MSDRIKTKSQYIDALKTLGPLVNSGINTRYSRQLAIKIWIYEQCRH